MYVIQQAKKGVKSETGTEVGLQTVLFGLVPDFMYLSLIFLSVVPEKKIFWGRHV